MKSVFPGFPAEGMAFFRGLARHNTREWFLPRKPVFEEHVRRPMVELVEAINAALARHAPEYVTDPDKAIYRFYRDTRFGSDKRPYKDRIAASFSRRGIPKHEGAGYYFSVSDKEVAIGGGVYMPPPESLAAIRARIAERHAEFRKILKAPALCKLFGEMQGERLSRPPKGFPADHPAVDLLQFKQFLYYEELPGDLATSPELYDGIWKRFRAMRDFMEFLNDPLKVRKRAPTHGLLTEL